MINLLMLMRVLINVMLILWQVGPVAPSAPPIEEEVGELPDGWEQRTVSSHCWVWSLLGVIMSGWPLLGLVMSGWSLVGVVITIFLSSGLQWTFSFCGSSHSSGISQTSC